MTLPAGIPSLFAIADEFGLARTSSFPSAFYGKGGTPTSGPLGFANFANTTAVQFSPDGGNVTSVNPGYSEATLYCSPAATWTYTGGGNRGTVNLASGGSATSITFAVTAQPLGQTGNTSTVQRTWNVTGVCGGVTRTFTVVVEAQGEQNGTQL